ncbi:hypothetical protein QQP08_010385 [Theobroma cacao]|nr:hypothetical protein QQP08_010385 [Theobroma cacao]
MYGLQIRISEFGDLGWISLHGTVGPKLCLTIDKDAFLEAFSITSGHDQLVQSFTLDSTNANTLVSGHDWARFGREG